MDFALLFALSYFGMGAYEARDGGRNYGWLWALLSIATSGVTIGLLKGGLGLTVCGQILLFFGIAVVRASFSK